MRRNTRADIAPIHGKILLLMVVIDCWPMPMTSTISGVREKMTDTQTRNKYQTLETNTPAGVYKSESEKRGILEIGRIAPY